MVSEIFRVIAIPNLQQHILVMNLVNEMPQTSIILSKLPSILSMYIPFDSHLRSAAQSASALFLFFFFLVLTEIVFGSVLCLWSVQAIPMYRVY